MMRIILICWILFGGAATLLAQKPGEAIPKVADEHESRGNKLADEGKFAEAEVEYKKAVEAAPYWYSPHYELAYLYWNQGKDNKEKALAKLETALRLNPECWLCYMLQGSIAEDTGNSDAAITLFKKASDLEPRRAKPWFALGVTYSRGGRAEDAIAAFTRAEELEPKYASPYYMLGLLYYRQERFFLAFDQLFAFAKLETSGKRYDKAKSLTGFNVVIDIKAPKGESRPAMAFCIARAGKMNPESYRKAHPGAGTYLGDLSDEAAVMESFATILSQLSESDRKPVPPRFASLVKAKQAGFMKEFLVAASGERFAKDKEALPPGRMDEFLAWAKKEAITLEIPRPRCEMRWMGRTW